MSATCLTEDAREGLVRSAWYSHDARWFAAVAAEFGIDQANRINRQVVRAVGAVEAHRLATRLGTPSVRTLPEFLAFLEAGRELYVAPPLMDIDVQVLDDRSYAMDVRSCFVAANITKAGIADDYECAVFDRVQGWHDALGLPLTEATLPARTCPLAGGNPCRRILEIQPEVAR